jgi:hypothetical protein
MNIYISPGNTKTGKIPSFSLPAGVSCVPEIPCYEDGCSGRRTECFRQAALRTRTDNYQALLEDMPGAFHRIGGYLQYTQPSFFRVGISGDFYLGDQSQYYLEYWFQAANHHPQTKFLAFTKFYDLDFSNCPNNFSVVWSAWPSYEIPDQVPDGVAGIAYVQDGTETRVPGGAFECPGNCETCGACWNIRKMPARATVFKKN